MSVFEYESTPHFTINNTQYDFSKLTRLQRLNIVRYGIANLLLWFRLERVPKMKKGGWHFYIVLHVLLRKHQLCDCPLSYICSGQTESLEINFWWPDALPVTNPHPFPSKLIYLLQLHAFLMEDSGRTTPLICRWCSFTLVMTSRQVTHAIILLFILILIIPNVHLSTLVWVGGNYWNEFFQDWIPFLSLSLSCF